MTFVRTQASSLAWTVAALSELRDLGVVDDDDVAAVEAISTKVLNVALQDPVFRGTHHLAKAPCKVCNVPVAP
jgi:hypothetical protein